MTFPIESVRFEICPPSPEGGLGSKDGGGLIDRDVVGGLEKTCREINIAAASPLRLSRIATELALAGKRDWIGQCMDPMRSELRIGSSAPFSFSHPRGQSQIAAHQIGLARD